MKRIFVLLVAVALGLSMTACAPTDPTPSEINTDTLKVAVICTTEEETAYSEAAAYLKQIEACVPALGLKKGQITFYSDVSATNSAIAEEAIEECIWDGCAVIFATAPGFEAAMKKKAAEYERVTFVGIGDADETLKNYYAYRIKTYDGAYFCGLLAGTRSKEGKLGMVTQNITDPEFCQIANAYLLGARVSNPKATLTVSSIGTVESTAKEEQAIKTLQLAGCDAVLLTTKGEAAKKTAALYDMHVSTIYTNFAATDTKVEYSVLPRFNNVFTDTMQAVLSKTAPLYHNAAYGYADGLLDCVPGSADDREVNADAYVLISAVQSLMMREGFDAFSGVSLQWKLGELKQTPAAVKDNKGAEKIAASAGVPTLKTLSEMTWLAEGISVAE